LTTSNHYYKNDLQRRLIFFLWAGQRITRSYKWTAVTTASDPPLEKYFQGRVTPSSSLANMHHFQERIMPSPAPKNAFSRVGWWYGPPLQMVPRKKIIIFLYDLRWSQTLYQNCREWRDLELCSWLFKII